MLGKLGILVRSGAGGAVGGWTVFSRGYQRIVKDTISSPSTTRGVDFLRDPRLYKGMAFTLAERQKLGIHGLLPPVFKTMDEQINRCVATLKECENEIERYIYLMTLQDNNEGLFYKLLADNLEELMPLVWTPTLGLACEQFSNIVQRPRGLYITIKDKGNVNKVIRNWPEQDVRLVLVTDGERILGLGDLGAQAMGLPVSMQTLHTVLGGIKPHHCLPVVLDVGTNNDKIRDDPFYIGLPQKRVGGPDYDQFLDEFMQAVVDRYGQHTIIQFDGFAGENAHRTLAKYRDTYCMYNNDIQGSSVVVMGGLEAANRITKKTHKDHRYLFVGAGTGATGVAMGLVRAMTQYHGLSENEAAERIWLCDERGLLVKSRAGQLKPHKHLYLKDMQQETDLEKMIELIKPSVLIGAASNKGRFTEGVIRKMGEINERPIIFAMSVPIEKSECTAEEAYGWTDGRAIFSSGSHFPAWKHPGTGEEFLPSHGNVVYVFPGIALGVMASGLRHIPGYLNLLAAKTLGEYVTEEQLRKGQLYPDFKEVFNLSVVIAKNVMEEAYKQGLASVYPEPKDKEQFLREMLYDFGYVKVIPDMYKWDK